MEETNRNSGFLTKKASMEARENGIFFEYSKRKTKPFNSKPTILCPEKAPFGDEVETGVFLGEGDGRESAASRSNQRGCPRGFCKREGKKHVDPGRQRQGDFYEFEVSLVTKLV